MREILLPVGVDSFEGFLPHLNSSPQGEDLWLDIGDSYCQTVMIPGSPSKTLPTIIL